MSTVLAYGLDAAEAVSLLNADLGVTIASDPEALLLALESKAPSVFVLDSQVPSALSWLQHLFQRFAGIEIVVVHRDRQNRRAMEDAMLTAPFVRPVRHTVRYEDDLPAATADVLEAIRARRRHEAAMEGRTELIDWLMPRQNREARANRSPGWGTELRQMSAGMAHTLNNHHSIILGNLELVSADPTLSEPNRSSLQQALQALERAMAIVANLQASGENSVLQLRFTDLSVVVAGSLERFEVPEHVSLKVELPPDPLVARVDVQLLTKAVSNLLTNAVEATSEEGTVEITVAGSRGHAQIRIRDTGSGMDAAGLRRACEPFYTTKFVGRGLGLSSTRGIVRSHGGTLDLESKPGIGTVAVIRLPLTDPATA